MSYEINGKEEQRFLIRLSAAPQYWVFADMNACRGKKVKITYKSPPVWN